MRKAGAAAQVCMPPLGWSMPAVPIVYHQAIEAAFAGWAEAIGRDPDQLRLDTVEALRTRWHVAQIGHPSDRADNPCLDVYRVVHRGITVFFSVEPAAVLVRGYGYDIEGEPRDDYDGGGYFS